MARTEGYRRSLLGENPRNSSGVFGSFFKLALVAAVVLAWGYWHVSSYGDTPVKDLAFSITKGETATSLPKKLKLEDSWRSKLYVRYFAPKVTIQVGTYRIEKGNASTFKEVFTKVLPYPQTKDVTVTFLPGWTVYDIDAYLTDMGVTEKGEVSAPTPETLAALTEAFPFLKGRENLEGYLYPDTYRIRPGADVVSVLSKALSNFDSKIYSKHKDLGDSLYGTLILASIVEKEERNVANKAAVAAVLQRRIDGKCADTGKTIGADATFCYPYGITSKECTPSFIVDHLDEDTEYNTRKHAGLPPTPISNPTDDSFLAARNPDGTACYYLHDSNGKIHFANDSAGHAKNKELYLR